VPGRGKGDQGAIRRDRRAIGGQFRAGQGSEHLEGGNQANGKDQGRPDDGHPPEDQPERDKGVDSVTVSGYSEETIERIPAEISVVVCSGHREFVGQVRGDVEGYAGGAGREAAELERFIVELGDE